MNSHNSTNILNKTSKAMRETPSGVLHAKSDRYGWTMDDNVGEFRQIKKSNLHIDGRYQRDKVSENKVLDIVRKWDWLLFGTLSVIQRDDGSYWVFDGGHRTRAAFYRDDIDLLPCLVHKIDGVNKEAKAFVERNTMTTNVSSFDRFHASVCAEDPTAQAASAMIKELGLTAVKGGFTTGSYISCIGAIQNCIAIDAVAARKVLEFCVKLAGDDIVTGRVLNAMFLLHQNFKPKFDVIDKYGDRIKRYSQREILIKMNQFSAECGKGGVKIHARAILEIVNYKARNRVTWDFE